MNFVFQVPDLDGEGVFVDAWTRDCFAVAGHQADLQETFGHFGCGLQQRGTKVADGTPCANIAEVRPNSRALAIHGLAIPASAFAENDRFPFFRVATDA